MNLFSSSKSKEGVCVLCHIGSADIYLSFVDVQEDLSSRVLYTTHEIIPISSEPTSKSLHDAMIGGLKKIVSRATEEGASHLEKKQVKSVFCTFSSPWYVAETYTKETSHENPYVFSEGYLKKVIDREARNFEQNISNDDGYPEVFLTNSTLLERIILQTRLNGYSTAHPENQKARKAEFSLFLSLVSKSFNNTVKDIFKEGFGVSHSTFHTLPFVSYFYLKYMFPKERDFIFIDITGEVSDIFIVRKEVMRETRSFSVGNNYILRRVAEEFDALPEMARSLIDMYNEGSLENEKKVPLKKVIDNSAKEWGEYLATALDIITENETAPSTVFMVSSAELAPLFSTTIKDILKENNSHVTLHNLNPHEDETGIEYAPHARYNTFIELEAFVWREKQKKSNQ